MISCKKVIDLKYGYVLLNEIYTPKEKSMKFLEKCSVETLMDTDLAEIFSEDQLEVVINNTLEHYLNLLRSKKEIIKGCQNQKIILYQKLFQFFASFNTDEHRNKLNTKQDDDKKLYDFFTTFNSKPDKFKEIYGEKYDQLNEAIK